jgi:diguanylate cyclase (GGDEF)-like protein
MQPINLDIRTLSFVSTTIALAFAAGLFVFGVQQKQFKGFSLLAIAVALFAIAPFLIGYRDILPDFITIVVANVLNIAGIIFFYEGIRRFLERPARFPSISILAVTIGFSLFLYFTYGAPSVNNRIIGYTAIHLMISVLCAEELSRDLHGSRRLPGLFTAFIFAVYGLYQLFRLLWTLDEGPIFSFMSAGNIHALSFFANIVLITGSTFGFVWMVNQSLIYDLTELAMHDPLTHALNRRGMELLAGYEFAKMKRVPAELSAVMIDIDHFKHVNDRFGHRAGDVVLMDFVNLIQKNLRAQDIFGRTGGEEFLVLLPNTGLDQTLIFAERFRKLVETYEFTDDHATVHITASFGIANCPPESISLDNLMLFTDKALLQAKQNGRNQISTFAYGSGKNHMAGRRTKRSPGDDQKRI